jgi:hypothetical protein
VTRVLELALSSFVACTLISTLPTAWADASATDKCHAKVVAVANDQMSLDVTLQPPKDPNSTDCKLARVKKADAASTNAAATGTSTTSQSGCTAGSDAPCDNITHLLVTDNLVKDQLKQLHKGDHIQIVYYSEEKKPTAPDKPTQPNASQPGAQQPAPTQPATGQAAARAATTPATKAPAAPARAPATPATPGAAQPAAPAGTGASTDVKTQLVLKAWCVDFETPSTTEILVALLGSAAVCLALTWLFSPKLGGRRDPRQLIISEDNRYSNSRFQMALWFFVLIVTYIAALCLRVWQLDWTFIGGINIPKNLLLLSGLSAITYAGAKGITSKNLAAPEAPGKPTAADRKTRAARPNFFLDLTHNDGAPPVPAQPPVLGPPPAPGMAPVVITPAVPAQPQGPPQFDFGDFQMVIVTLIAVATYVVLVFNFFGHVEYSKVVSLPDVDTTLLATFGLGQGAYLTKKAVGNVGTS